MFSLVVEVSFSGSSSYMRGYGMDSIDHFLPCLFVRLFAILLKVGEAQISGSRILCIRRLSPNAKSPKDFMKY